MTIENPSAVDVKNLKDGDTVRVNERTRYTVGGILPSGGAYLTGPRGGWANLVPSTCGKAVQLTTLHKRDWIKTLEIS